MSEVVARMLRAAGHLGGPRLRLLAFAADPQGGAALVDQLSSFGVATSLVMDERTAAQLLADELEYDGIVAHAAVTRDKLEEIAARAGALRPGRGPLAVIHLADDAGRPSEPVKTGPPKLLLQSVTPQDLGAALDAVSRSAALASADVQRQVEAIARAVIRLGQRINPTSHSPATMPILEGPENADVGTDPPLDSVSAIAGLRRLIQARGLRQRFFQEARFGEPAWDIILDLSLAWFEKKSVSVSSLCIAAGVPMSTAMRWINEMIEAGLIERWIDPTDGRRNLVQIAPETRQAMLHYLVALDRLGRQAEPSSSGLDARAESSK